MLSGLCWLALETKELDRLRSFYADRFDLPVREEGDREVVFAAGDTELRLRRPTAVPRGGLHTHFAFSAPESEYDNWWDRLSESHELSEHSFGSTRSLYLYDPDGNCVEIGGIDDEGNGITGIFEIVLEVADLDRAESFYTELGFEPIDRGDDRRRVRLRGPMDLELWEPQLGIADARGGVHVDLGFATDDPSATAAAVSDRACSVERLDDAVRVLDPDGHYLTFR